MGQILSIIFRWLWGGPDDKKKPSEKLPLVSPPSSRPALQPSLGSFRDYTLQSNALSHPPVALISSSSSSTQSKSSGASRFEPQQQTHHQLNLSSYGLSSKIASSPSNPRLDTHQQLSSTSCRPSSTTQIHPKLVKTHQPLSSNSFGLSDPSGTSHAQPKIQTHSSLLSSSGTGSGVTGAPHLQPVIVPLTSAPSRNLGINDASPRNSGSDGDALNLSIPAKLKIQVVGDVKLPLVSPSRSRPALQPSLGSFRDYTLQSNVLAHPPVALISSSSSSTQSKSSGASRFEPQQLTHHQLNLGSYGLSSKTASSPSNPRLDTHQQLSSTSCRPSSTTQIHPKLVKTHQPLSSNSFGLSNPSDTSHAQPKIQTHASLLSSSGTGSGVIGAPHLQPVIVPLTSAPSRNLGIHGASPRNSRSDGDALNLLISAKLKIEVVGDEKQVSARLQQYNRIEEKDLVRGVVGKNWCDYRSREEDEDLEEQKLSIEVRWIKHYRNDYKILLVGEGDFSFSASLAEAFVSATNITATSLDSIEFLSKNYKNALSNINKLRSLGAKVMHDVDATKMANVFPFNCMRFDRVVYNFPLAGFFPNESKEVEIWRHRMLVQQFFENAKSMIEINGEIHITHKSNGFFMDWNLEFLASRVGLRLIEEVPFNFKDYPGYRTKYGFGGDKNFDCIPSNTYKFGLKKPTEKSSHRFMR